MTTDQERWERHQNAIAALHGSADTTPAGKITSEYEWVALGQTSIFGGLLIRWWRSVDHAQRDPHQPVLVASAEGVTLGHLVTLHSIPGEILDAAKDCFAQLAAGRADLARRHITHHWERSHDGGFDLVKGAMP